MISLWESELEAEIRAIRVKEQADKERQEQARARAQERVNAGQHDPVQAYNEANPIEYQLSSYGYHKKGDRYLNPNSESGKHGATIQNGKVFSHNSSDADIGRKCSDGVLFDAFDLFCHYEHGGNYDRAVRAAGDRFTLLDPIMGDTVTLTKFNQRQFRREQAHNQHNGTTVTPGPDNPKKTQKPFDIVKFSLTGLSREMKKQMLEDRFILGKMAILGQSTAFYAKPNTGKTLITLKEIINGIESGEVKGEDIIYVNADDTYKGLTYKLEIAEKYGFHMVAPSHSRPGEEPFKSEDLAVYLKSMVETHQAKGKVFVLDTVKKFTDLMSKNKCSEFGESVRQFVSHGGSVIMLAHANKHRGEDQKIVYSGTADLVDDADCAYTIDCIQDDPDGLRTIKFENFKQRGDVALEVFYQYDYLPGTPYHERLESVIAMDEEDRKKTLLQQRLNAQLARNQPAIEAITESIREGVTSKTALIAESHSKSDISKAKIRKALEEHTGSEKSKNQFWHIEPGEKNASVYCLNYGCKNAKNRGGRKK